MSRHLFILRNALFLLAGLALPSAFAGRRGAVVETPQPVRLQLVDEYLDTNVEVEREIQKTGDPGVTVTRQRILVQPEVGVGLAGSIYHPNFLGFRFSTGLGLDWQDSSLNPGGSATDSHLLQRYHGTMEFLRQKPYAISFYADKDMLYRDYDIFSRVRVDSERFGVRSGYSAGPIPFTISLQHYEEQEANFTRPVWRTDDTLGFSAQNHRRFAQGSTQLSYNLTEYSRTDSNFSADKALNQSLSLYDTERFGEKVPAHLTSVLNYNSITETAVPTDRVSVQENFELQHTARLRSMYEYGFDNSTAGDADSNTHQGRVGLTHQLYENLTTSLDVHGSRTGATSPGSSLTTSRVGAGFGEQYSRRLSTWGDLALGYDGRYDHEERDAGGSLLVVNDESHTLSDSTHTFLNQPMVSGNVHVTDSTGTIIYVEGLDYLLIPRGTLTEIQRVPGGNITDGSVVLVDYSSTLQPSASYDSFANAYHFRLNLLGGLASLYGRWNTMDFSGASQLVLQTYDDKVLGVDTTWRWLRAGAEYEILDSNLAPYKRFRLFESFHFRPQDHSSLSLDFDQNWTTFQQDNMQQTSYGMIAHYQWLLTRCLSWNTEGGVRIERGDTFDRDFATGRTEFSLAVGKLNFRLGYEYNYESHTVDLRERHYFYLRARRSF